MKKGLKTLLATLLATSCCTTVLVATGCSSKSGGKKPSTPTPPPTECTEHVDVDGNGFCDNCNEKMPESGGEEEDDEYTISIDGKTVYDLDIGEAVNLKWGVYKNGNKMDTPPSCTVTVNNNKVTYDKTTGKVTAAEKGSAIATVTLDSDSDVKATVRFTVHDYFFNHKLDRGEWNSAFEDSTVNPKITINGGQAAVLVKEADTRFVFKYTLKMAATDVSTDQSFGIASFLPTSGAQVGDNALWFGVRGTKTRGVYGAFVKQFYNGWGTGDEYIQQGYSAMDVGFEDVEFVVIRDGLDYYYSINGYYGKYTVKNAAHADVATYAGIYSQTIAFDVSNYSWSNNQADVNAAIAEYYTNKGIAAISINESYKTDIVKGRSETFTAAAYPTDKAAGASLVWSLDKSEMTSGAAGTQITENGGVATLSVADDADGYVYVVCSANVDGKTVSQRVRVEILQRDLSDSNDAITVYGGVELNDKNSNNWSITFPEDRMYKNGISLTGEGHEDIYEKTNYCAVLNTNYSKDYSLEFKFSNYKNSKSSPKLQLSLGANKNNFYLVYNAGAFRVESFTQGTQSNGFTTAGWHNTQWIHDFNPDAEHTFKLTISDRGVYSVFIDGAQYGFYAVGGNQELTNSTTIVRKYANYDDALPIKFATDGCSVKLSDITVTDGTHASSEHNFWSEHQSYTFEGENSFKMVVPIITDSGADGWQYGQWPDYKTYYTKALDSSGYAIDLDVVFGSVMTDGKFVMRVGNNGAGSYEIQFNNKSAGLSLAYKKDNNWDGSIERAVRVDTTNPLKIKARVEVRDNKLRVIANGRTILETPYSMGQISTNSDVEFYIFNKTAGDVWSTANSKKYAEVSNFAVSGRDFVAADVYELQNTASDNNIDIYYSMDNTPKGMPVRVLHNGAPVAVGGGYSLAYSLKSDDKAYFEFDAQNGTICGKNLEPDAVVEGTVTVMLKNASGDILDSIDYHVAAYNKATSNNYVSVKGGVILDSQGATDANYSLTFPMSKIDVNGVGENAESKYEDNNYSANLTATVKGDFSIEFTVSDYVSNTAYPKLMVSLGGSCNQFYVTYNREGTIHHVETFVNASSTAGHGASGWISSDAFQNFDTAASHTYKITCIGGVYKVYLDGTELRFSFDSDNDHNTATLYRNIRDYGENMPIRIATKGVSAKVSNITVTDLNTGDVNLPAFYSYQTGHTDMTDTGFTMQLAAAKCLNNASNNDEAWNFRYSMYHKMAYLESINTDTQIEFDIDFSGMNDGKLVMQTGSWEYHFMDKTGAGNGMSFQLYPNGWGEPTTTISSGSAQKKMHVVFERKERKVWLYINGIRVLNGRADADNSCVLDFFIFGEANDIGKTLTVSNFTEKPYSDATRYDYYEISATQANIGIKPGNAATTIGYTITKNDVTVTEAQLPAGVTVEYSISASDYIKLDADHKVYATGEFTGTQTATVTISLKKGGEVITSVNVGITSTAKETQNSTLSVSGGALLNYTDTPDEAGWSVTFPEAKINVDGIATGTYTAEFVQKAVGDTSVEFTVSNYKFDGTENQRLMVSLGDNNRFDIRYNGTDAWIEATADGYHKDNGDHWVKEFTSGMLKDYFGGTFNTAQAHVYKVAIVKGIYKVYVDGTELHFTRSDNNDPDYTIVASGYNTQRTARISPSHVSADISGITYSKGEISTFMYNNNVTNVTENGFDMRYCSDWWSNSTFHTNGNYVKYGPGITESTTIEFDFDAKFCEDIGDWGAKVLVSVGGRRLCLTFRDGSNPTVKVCMNWSGDEGISDWQETETGVHATDNQFSNVHVKIVRENGKIKTWVGGTLLVWNGVSERNGDTDSTLAFAVFNNSGAAPNYTASIRNLVVTNN